MSAEEEFKQLPQWLQDLWNLQPSIARNAENDLRATTAERDEWKAKYELAFRVAGEKQAERDELRATVQAQAEQIEAMELERGELILARDYARNEAEAQAAQLEQARSLLNLICKCSVDEANDAFDKIKEWLAANAPQDVNTAA